MSRKYELTADKKRKIKDMIKNINSNFFKNSKLKLCTIGTLGIILSASLTGCAFTNHIQNHMQHHDNNYNVTENTTDSLEDKERATITLEYEGLESIPERDIITFTNLDAGQISGIAATNAEGRELTLKPGRYAITSNYLEEEYFEIENSNEKWTLEADYNSNTLKITENNK